MTTATKGDLREAFNAQNLRELGRLAEECNRLRRELEKKPAPVVANPASVFDRVMDTIASIDAGTEHDVVAELLLRAEYLKQQAKLVDDAIKAKAIEWCQAGKREIEAGTIKWYVGNKKKTECVNIPETIEAVLTATGGDVQAFATLLSSQPFKHGATGKVLDATTFKRLFLTTTEPKLESDGEPVAQLQKLDTQFIR